MFHGTVLATSPQAAVEKTRAKTQKSVKSHVLGF